MLKPSDLSLPFRLGVLTIIQHAIRMRVHDCPYFSVCYVQRTAPQCPTWRLTHLQLHQLCKRRKPISVLQFFGNKYQSQLNRQLSTYFTLDYKIKYNNLQYMIICCTYYLSNFTLSKSATCMIHIFI